jgi:hypothetical protein
MVITSEWRLKIQNCIVYLLDDSLSSRFERGFLESFMYNYDMSLLLHDDSILGIPNPFETVVYLRQVLKHPLLPCEVAWMNHPVFCSSFDAFEMAIKTSYLFKHLNHPKTRSAAEHLLEAAVNYPKPTIPAEVHRNPEKLTQLQDLVLLTEAMLGVVKLLLRKVIHPDIGPNDILTQKDVGVAARRLQRITVRSEVRAISPWCLLILGLVCIYDHDRSTVIDAILQYSDMVHARYMYSVIDVLEIGWGVS